MTQRVTNASYDRFQIVVHLLEDMHSGSGTGSGDIDAVQAKDRDGHPVVWASHFKGLLRSAGEELVQLGQCETRLLDMLLGRTRDSAGALTVTSLHIAQGTRASTVRWTSAAREPGGRRAADNTLRTIEYTAAGSTLSSEFRLRAPRSAKDGHTIRDGANKEDLAALFQRLMRRIDRIGGDRNRGAGLIRSEVRPLPPLAVTQPEGTGRRLKLLLRNIEPLCLPSTGHPGNLIRTQSFIRGQTLRGAMLAWALQQHNMEGAALIQEGKVSFGDALPLPDNLARAPQWKRRDLQRAEVAPVPLSLHVTKSWADGTERPWWAAPTSAPRIDTLGDRSRSDENLKRPGPHDYVFHDGVGRPQYYAPLLRVHLRNAVPLSQTSGKTVLEDVQLFSSEEIAEDTRFLSELRFVSDDDGASFCRAFAPLLCGAEWLAIGRGGRPVVIENNVWLRWFEPRPAYPDDWTLTLTSDLVARGPSLGFYASLDVPALWDLVGRKSDDSSASGGEDWDLRAYSDTEGLHGFNAASGLRRVPALALRRGSTWRVRGAGSGRLADALEERLFIDGALGERQAEGCGRFHLQPSISPATGAVQLDALEENQREVVLTRAKEIAVEGRKCRLSRSQLQGLRAHALSAPTNASLLSIPARMRAIQDERPQSGISWKTFPIDRLETTLNSPAFASAASKRQLIAHVVDWLLANAPRQQEKDS